MRTLRLWILAGFVAGLSLTACEDDGGDPSADEFYGLWANEDAGTIRVFEFAAMLDDAELGGLTNVYRIYVYPSGTTPEMVQRGSYRVAFGRLVTTVLWSGNGQNIGQDFGNDILGLSSSRMTLESTSTASGERVFDRVSTLP